MMTNKTSRSILAVILVAVAGTFASADVLMEYSFDGNSGNDTGPAMKAYKWGNLSSATLSTGVLFTHDKGHYRASFAQESGVDASAADSFTVTWTVTSFSTNAATTFGSAGWGMGVCATNRNYQLWRDCRPTIAVLIHGGTAGNWVLADVNAANTLTTHALAGAMPTAESLADGFTVTLTVNSDDTWEVSTTGLSNTSTTTGSLSGNVTYADLAGSLHAVQSIPGAWLTVTVASVQLSAGGTVAANGTMIIFL